MHYSIQRKEIIGDLIFNREQYSISFAHQMKRIDFDINVVAFEDMGLIDKEQ